jgi:hypothetical protein
MVQKYVTGFSCGWRWRSESKVDIKAMEKGVSVKFPTFILLLYVKGE